MWGGGAGRGGRHACPLCRGILLIIYYPQSPEDNGENLGRWVESSLLYVAQKPPPILQKQRILSGAPTQKDIS